MRGRLMKVAKPEPRRLRRRGSFIASAFAVNIHLCAGKPMTAG